MNRVDTDVRMGVANGICAVTVSKGKALDAFFGSIDSELKNLASKTVDMYSGEVADRVTKRLDRTMSAVPCGFPVMSPHWVLTVNVWTYEVVGKYQVFTVIDNDNEVIPKPYFGHKGQRYVRQEGRIAHPLKQKEDGSPLMIGENAPIKFQINGYASTIVGTGPKGVGDKLGGNTEKSVSYDDLVLEMAV